jgi:hypothetical protein
MKPAVVAICCVAVLASGATIGSTAPFQSEPDAVSAIETNQTGTVRGRVVDTEGEPMESAHISLLLVFYAGEEYSHHFVQPPAVIAEAGFQTPAAMNMFLARPGERYVCPRTAEPVTTDESGRYEIQGIPGGYSYEMRAWAHGYGRDCMEEFLVEPGEVYIARDLVLHVTHMSIEGTVRYMDGEPVAHASVTGSGAATGDRWAETDRNGRFRLENLVDEQIRIRADKSGPTYYEATMAPESPSSADSARPRAGSRWYGEATAMAGDEHVNVVLNKEQESILVELAMYHPQRHIRGEMSLTDDVWSGIDEDEHHVKRGPMEFFTLADLKIGDMNLKADQSGWTWDGKAEPPKDAEITCVSCPKVAALPGKWCAFADVETVYHEYFERRADGLFELKTFPAIFGVFAGFEAEHGESGRIILRDLTIDWTDIVRRRPIEGVNLNIGPPIIEEPLRTTVSLEPGRYYGMLMPTSGGENLIIRLRVDVKDPVEGEE